MMSSEWAMSLCTAGGLCGPRSSTASNVFTLRGQWGLRFAETSLLPGISNDSVWNTATWCTGACFGFPSRIFDRKMAAHSCSPSTRAFGARKCPLKMFVRTPTVREMHHKLSCRDTTLILITLLTNSYVSYVDHQCVSRDTAAPT